MRRGKCARRAACKMKPNRYSAYRTTRTRYRMPNRIPDDIAVSQSLSFSSPHAAWLCQVIECPEQNTLSRPARLFAMAVWGGDHDALERFTGGVRSQLCPGELETRENLQSQPTYSALLKARPSRIRRFRLVQ